MKPGHRKGPVAFNKIYYLNADSVGCRYNANAVQYHNSDIGYMVAVTEVEYKPEFESPRDTTYLAPTGELCGVFVKGFGENWSQCIISVCFITVQSYACANNRIHYVPMVLFVCLHFISPHYHHYADISEGAKLLKCLSGTFCRVCVE